MRRAAAFTARPSTPRTNGISFGRHQPRSLRYKPSFRAPFRILDIAPAITPLDFAPRFALFLADDFFADFFAFLAMLHLPKRMDNSGCMIRRESATRNQLFPQGGSEKKKRPACKRGFAMQAPTRVVSTIRRCLRGLLTFVDVQLPNTARGEEASTFCSCTDAKPHAALMTHQAAHETRSGDVLIPHC
jgi:hypothetical protein